MKSKFACGCVVEVASPSLGPVSLTYCPLHQAAPDLLAAAEAAYGNYYSYLTSGEGPRSFIPSMDRLGEAVKKAKGEGGCGMKRIIYKFEPEFFGAGSHGFHNRCSYCNGTPEYMMLTVKGCRRRFTSLCQDHVTKIGGDNIEWRLTELLSEHLKPGEGD